MAAFYNQGDQAIYNSGQYFIPQEKYRLNLGNNKILPNTFNSNNLSNSGIMSQAPFPYIYPPINQGGEGGGGGFTGPATDNSGFDYESEAYGIDPTQGLTEEEQEALDAQIAGPQMSKLGTLGTLASFFTAPLTTMGFLHRRNQKKQKELEETTRQAGIQADFDRAMKQGRDFYDTLNDGRGASVSDKSREEAGSGFSDVSESGPFADGGRVGYFFGGRVNFKNGGLASIL